MNYRIIRIEEPDCGVHSCPGCQLVGKGPGKFYFAGMD